jgi:prepilin-type N-terminal cleavage/methylation domain-containing protein
MKARQKFMLHLFKKRTSNRKGFTLVELLVVVAIIGILAAIAIPRFTSANETARGAQAQADLRTIESAAQIYQASAGATAAAIATLVNSNLLVATPTPPQGAWRAGSANGTNNATAYGWSGGRPTFAGSTVEQLR